MNMRFKTMKSTEADTLVVYLFEEDLKTLNDNLNKVINFAKDKGIFEGKKGQVYNFTRDIEDTLQNVILVGLGKQKEFTLDIIRSIAGKAIRKCRVLKAKNVFLRVPEVKEFDLVELIKGISYGTVLGLYTFNKYKTEENKNNDLNISIGASYIDDNLKDSLDKAIDEIIDITDGIVMARDLVNEPSNVIYPESLANKASEVGEKLGFEVEIFDVEKIKELKMEAFYNVAKASEKEPKFIIMRYFGDEENKDEILGLVGKGLTYDAGGYSIKPTSSMIEMKSDMGGAAAVIGAMSVIAKRKVKKNIVAVIAACENLISGNAYKPGEIIGSMAGKTIEVVNTDAEGRLTLIDAIHYVIEKENANKIIDIATLTGAALHALGETTTPVVTNNQEFYNELEMVSRYTGEKMWQLPAFDEYKKLIKSEIADLKNSGGRYAGTITAGLFIGEFVKQKPWLHLDIAGTSWLTSSDDLNIKGGTGAPVYTLYELIKRR